MVVKHLKSLLSPLPRKFSAQLFHSHRNSVVDAVIIFCFSFQWRLVVVAEVAAFSLSILSLFFAFNIVYNQLVDLCICMKYACNLKYNSVVWRETHQQHYNKERQERNEWNWLMNQKWNAGKVEQKTKTISWDCDKDRRRKSNSQNLRRLREWEMYVSESVSLNMITKLKKGGWRRDWKIHSA